MGGVIGIMNSKEYEDFINRIIRSGIDSIEVVKGNKHNPIPNMLADDFFHIKRYERRYKYKISMIAWRSNVIYLSYCQCHSDDTNMYLIRRYAIYLNNSIDANQFEVVSGEYALNFIRIIQASIM